MNDASSGSGPDDGETGSWATETLPMHVRKELLERELKKLGFRKRGQASYDSPSGQQNAQGGSSHPSAGSKQD